MNPGRKRKAAVVLLWGLAGAGLIFSGSASAEIADASALGGKSVLFVVGAGEYSAESDDLAIKSYFESLGLRVSLTSIADLDTAGKSTDLIVVSSTADARILQDRFRETPIPLLTWNAYLYPELAMTGRVLHQDFSVVRESVAHNLNHASFYSYCVNATHPIAQAADCRPVCFWP